METSASSTHVSQTQLLKHRIRSPSPQGQSFAQVNVDTNDPIFLSGVDTQVVFYAMGIPEAFRDVFAFDPIEA